MPYEIASDDWNYSSRSGGSGCLGCSRHQMAWVRASSAPGALESALARSVRNFSIPRAESRQTNPVAGDRLALQQGRDSFLSRCASCHGVDGRGLTPIGANEYPRAPDLHSEQTQSLTDGDMHYIIENGVQLTGMPAMHSEPSSESWKLVSYIRSLRTATPPEAAILEHVASTAHYVGSESCQKCHAATYERWKKTPMANVVRDPRQHPDAIIPDLRTNNIAKFTLDQVALVYGAASGSSATSRRLVTIIIHCPCNGTSATRNGLSITFPIPELIGGRHTICPTISSALRDPPKMVATQLTTISMPNWSPNGTSDASDATVPAANMLRIQRGRIS